MASQSLAIGGESEVKELFAQGLAGVVLIIKEMERRG